MEDVGTASLSECVMIGGWIARAVQFPVILDGDTGHGGIMAVRRLVEDCIKEGLAGIRIDDQPIEGKRGTGTAGMEVESLDVVLARYRAAVDRKRDLDPNFVVIAQCYAGEAAGSDLEATLHRLRLYKEVGGVEWVQFTAPRSVQEVQRARQTVTEPSPLCRVFCIHSSPMTTYWPWASRLPGCHAPRIWSSRQRCTTMYATSCNEEPRRRRILPHGISRIPTSTADSRVGGVQVATQRALEEQYLAPEALAKYQHAPGTS